MDPLSQTITIGLGLELAVPFREGSGRPGRWELWELQRQKWELELMSPGQDGDSAPWVMRRSREGHGQFCFLPGLECAWALLAQRRLESCTPAESWAGCFRAISLLRADKLALPRLSSTSP